LPSSRTHDRRTLHRAEQEKGIIGNIYKGRGRQVPSRDAGRLRRHRPGEGGVSLLWPDVFDTIEEYETLMEENGKKERRWRRIPDNAAVSSVHPIEELLQEGQELPCPRSQGAESAPRGAG